MNEDPLHLCKGNNILGLDQANLTQTWPKVLVN